MPRAIATPHQRHQSDGSVEAQPRAEREPEPNNAATGKSMQAKAFFDRGATGAFVTSLG
jgi:hypothetical protein